MHGGAAGINVTRHREPPLGGVVIQNFASVAAALDCFVVALLAKTADAASQHQRGLG